MAQRKYRVSITPQSIDISKRNEAECISISRSGKIAHHVESAGSSSDSMGAGFDCYAIGGILRGTGVDSDQDVLVAIDRVEKVGVLSRSEVLRVKGIRLVYVAQPKVDVKSKQLNDIAELMAKGEYYFSLAEADAEAEDLTLSFLNEIRGIKY